MKQFIIPVLAIAALAGCSKGEEPPELKQDGTIRIFSGIDSPTVKSVATQSTGVSNVQFMRLDGSSAPTDYSNTTPFVGNIAATTGVVTFTITPSYSKDNENAYFIAYYPTGTLAEGKVTWTIDGATDILCTDAVWDAGKYTAPITGENGTKLTLNHQLSQVEVVCQAESGADIAAVNAAWGKVKSVEFVNAPTQLTYTLNGLTIAKEQSTSNFALLKNYNGTIFEASDIAVNGSVTPIAQAMLPPVGTTAGTCSFKLKITTEGTTTAPGDDIVKEININLNGDFSPMVAGHSHKATLTFKADNRTISVTNSVIEEWTVGNSASADVEK